MFCQKLSIFLIDKIDRNHLITLDLTYFIDLNCNTPNLQLNIYLTRLRPKKHSKKDQKFLKNYLINVI